MEKPIVTYIDPDGTVYSEQEHLERIREKYVKILLQVTLQRKSETWETRISWIWITS